jgi:hypothetical protein
MKKLKYLLILFFLFPLSLLAQQTTISGKVIDFTDGSALPGVSVKIKGTTAGTITDVSGKFTLSVAHQLDTAIYLHRLYRRKCALPTLKTAPSP